MRPIVRLALLAAAVVACSGTPAPPDDADASMDASHDAGRDTAPSDVGRDVGADASDATSRDATSRDAIDAAHDSGICEPRWVRFPGMPDTCYVEYASHPECVVYLSWLPCPSYLPACTRLWVEPFDPIQYYVQNDNSFWDPAMGRGGFLLAAETRTGNELIHTRVVAASDGNVLAAVRDYQADFLTTQCFAAAAASAAALAVRIDHLDSVAMPPPHPVHMFRGAPSDWFDHPLSVATFDSLPMGASAQNFSTSATVTVSLIVPAQYLLVWRGGDPTTHATPGYALQHAIIGDDLFWESAAEDGRNTTRIYHTGPSDTDDLLIDGVATNQDIFNFTTDGTNMAWYLVTSTSPTGLPTGGDVLVAPYATIAADLHPRVLRGGLVDSEGFTPVLGPDAVAYAYAVPPEYPSYLDLVLLADGSRSRIVLPIAGVPLRWHLDGNPLWVTADEVAVNAGVSRPQTTILRFPRSAFSPAP